MGTLLAGSVLPDYTDINGAWQETFALPNPGLGKHLQYVCQSGYIDVVLSMFSVFTTDATAVNRFVYLQNITASLARNFQVGSATTQPGSTQNTYTFVAGISQAYGSSATRFTAPFPQNMLNSGDMVSLEAGGMQPNDFFDTCSITVIHVPTKGTVDPQLSMMHTPMVA